MRKFKGRDKKCIWQRTLLNCNVLARLRRRCKDKMKMEVKEITIGI
jgi:hypothetical protein